MTAQDSSPEGEASRRRGTQDIGAGLFLIVVAAIAAWQARVKELEYRLEIDVALDIDGNEIPAPPNMPDGIYCRNATIQLQNEALSEFESLLTQRTAECDALKLVNDTHMKTVMKLSHVVEQRTAELERVRALVKTYADAKIDFDDKRLQEDHHAWRERYTRLVGAETILIALTATSQEG